MNDQSRMCGQLNLWDTPNAIFSPESASGPSLCDKPDGPITRQFGQDHALVSLSARQAKAAGLLTSGTSGPRFTFSSSSASLQSSLASRLRAVTAMLGSTLYRMTWKQRVMPSGRLKPSLAASALRTSDPEITGWPTPQVADDNHSRAKDPQAYAKWWLARPNAGTCTAAIAQAMAAWPTPKVADGRGNTYQATEGRRSELRKSVHLTGWPTPTVGNANGSQMAKGASATGRRPDGSKATVSLNAVGQLSAWPTPLTHDTNPRGAGNRNNPKGGGACLAWDAKSTATDGPARLTVTGEMLTGSDAQTKSGGQLNPAHSLWLMLGPFATAWASCGERVTRSRSGKRKASSKP